MKARRPRGRVVWRRTASAEHPFEAVVDGRRWTIRVNDFPTRALYTLLADGEEVEDLESWPAEWARPA